MYLYCIIDVLAELFDIFSGFKHFCSTLERVFTFFVIGDVNQQHDVMKTVSVAAAAAIVLRRNLVRERVVS